MSARLRSCSCRACASLPFAVAFVSTASMFNLVLIAPQLSLLLCASFSTVALTLLLHRVLLPLQSPGRLHRQSLAAVRCWTISQCKWTPAVAVRRCLAYMLVLPACLLKRWSQNVHFDRAHASNERCDRAPYIITAPAGAASAFCTLHRLLDSSCAFNGLQAGVLTAARRALPGQVIKRENRG
ncbi:hypothetical protein COO60DRAFT_135072 [Scenedesmus sp. NREL 46B-D3]|nr:hypothetical protein COO60DRAFT_135072 [Scenedesmus sp. NREL 46B-D3]